MIDLMAIYGLAEKYDAPSVKELVCGVVANHPTKNSFDIVAPAVVELWPLTFGKDMMRQVLLEILECNPEWMQKKEWVAICIKNSDIAVDIMLKYSAYMEGVRTSRSSDYFLRAPVCGVKRRRKE